MARQHCTVCAWREHCNKRFSIPDNGSRCPDFCRDVSIKESEDTPATIPAQKEQPTK